MRAIGSPLFCFIKHSENEMTGCIGTERNESTRGRKEEKLEEKREKKTTVPAKTSQQVTLSLSLSCN